MITTRVDELITHLDGKEKVAMQDVAAELGVPMDTLQSWVDFLVEEGIIGIEYKFTKPYIYLNEGSKGRARVTDEEKPTWDAFRTAFLSHAKQKQIPDIKAAALWKNHVLAALEKEKRRFYDEARKRELTSIDSLWNEYKVGVLMKV